MSTALTLYAIPSASSTLPTAENVISSGATGAAGTVVNTTIGVATGWGEIVPLGTANAWAGASSQGAPSGNGLLFDSLSLEGQQLLSGNYTPTINLKAAGIGTPTLAGTLVVRYYIRSSGGVYILIGSNTLTGQSFSSTSQSFAFPAANLAAANFGTGDKLYIDIWFNCTSNTGSSSGTKIGWKPSSLTTSGWTGSQFVTPGYLGQSVQSASETSILEEDPVAVIAASTNEPIIELDNTSLVVVSAVVTETGPASESSIGNSVSYQAASETALALDTPIGVAQGLPSEAEIGTGQAVTVTGAQPFESAQADESALSVLVRGFAKETSIDTDATTSSTLIATSLEAGPLSESAAGVIASSISESIQAADIAAAVVQASPAEVMIAPSATSVTITSASAVEAGPFSESSTSFTVSAQTPLETEQGNETVAATIAASQTESAQAVSSPSALVRSFAKETSIEIDNAFVATVSAVSSEAGPFSESASSLILSIQQAAESESAIDVITDTVSALPLEAAAATELALSVTQAALTETTLALDSSAVVIGASTVEAGPFSESASGVTASGSTEAAVASESSLATVQATSVETALSVDGPTLVSIAVSMEAGPFSESSTSFTISFQAVVEGTLAGESVATLVSASPVETTSATEMVLSVIASGPIEQTASTEILLATIISSSVEASPSSEITSVLVASTQAALETSVAYESALIGTIISITEVATPLESVQTVTGAIAVEIPQQAESLSSLIITNAIEQARAIEQSLFLLMVAALEASTPLDTAQAALLATSIESLIASELVASLSISVQELSYINLQTARGTIALRTAAGTINLQTAAGTITLKGT